MRTSPRPKMSADWEQPFLGLCSQPLAWAPNCSPANNGYSFWPRRGAMKGAFLWMLESFVATPPVGDELRFLPASSGCSPALNGPLVSTAHREMRVGEGQHPWGWVVRTAFAWTHQLQRLLKAQLLSVGRTPARAERARQRGSRGCRARGEGLLLRVLFVCFCGALRILLMAATMLLCP